MLFFVWWFFFCCLVWCFWCCCCGWCCGWVLGWVVLICCFVVGVVVFVGWLCQRDGLLVYSNALRMLDMQVLMVFVSVYE
ncbi:hypothetical protein, partial [Pseudomonas syringae group genomosp. 7]|uniref:hypothetical protein n=1 Tax=Pseudomonas syringae group genomosp. 7 TaxID=251699 RepID=UPI00377016DB